MQQQNVIKLKGSDVTKRIRAKLKEAYPDRPARFFSVSVDTYGTVTIEWENGPTKDTVGPLCEMYNNTHMGQMVTFTEEGLAYKSYTRIHYKRMLTKTFYERAATIICRKYGEKLPTKDSDPYIETEGEQLSRLIATFVSHLDEKDLDAEEKKADELYPPLIAFSEEEQAKQQRDLLQKKLAWAYSYELARQRLLFAHEVHRLLNHEKTIDKIESDLRDLDTRMKAVFPTYADPVICSYCFTPGTSYQQVGTNYACASCIAQEIPNPEEHEQPAPLSSCLPDEIVPSADTRGLVSLLPRQEHEEVYQFERDWQGIYYGKNGEPVPIVTRDLLHDIRFGNWWIGFAYKPDEEVRKALHDGGWRWGPGRKQWYHQNKFALVPSIVYEVYGGYVDGGFCEYRATRGERLRRGADIVEGKAGAMQEMSNDLVSRYMSSGTLIVGPRQTRSLTKKKARAERYAHEARMLDAYAQVLRYRANDSERHQAYVTSVPVIRRTIERLESESRILEKHFGEMVMRAAEVQRDPSDRAYKTLPQLLKHYEEVERQREVIDEEVQWLREVIEARRERVMAQPREVSERVAREFAVENVVEVNVGAENRFDLFPTPEIVGTRLVTELDTFEDTELLILEPNGGTGSLLKVIQSYYTKATIHTCEIAYDLQEILRDRGYNVVGADFLYYNKGLYDLVIMNPPFSAWLKHVLHAYELLKDGGLLLAILPMSFFSRTNEKILQFRALVDEHGSYQEIPAGAFAESGTNIPTVMISLRK